MAEAIRATEHKDLPALAKFLIRVYQFVPSDHHADTQLLEWKYLRPRPAWEGSRSYLLEKNEGIIAHCGIVPVTFHTPDGTEIKTLTMTDWGADPAVPGAGIRLFRKLMDKVPASFVIGGAPVTQLIIPRIGFRQMGEASTYSAWLRPWREFRTRRPRNRRSLLRLAHGLSHRALIRSRESAGWSLTPVHEFDDSLLPVLKSTKRAWTFCERTLEDLNYLLKCPQLEMTGFLLKRQERIMGYCVIGRSEWEARLLDIVVDSVDASDWKHACAAVTQAAYLDPAVCRIRAQASFPTLSEALSRSGYWLQYKEPIMIHDSQKLLEHAFPINFQFFDGDSGY
jgi:Acetyltransferase (GNAT) domain